MVDKINRFVGIFLVLLMGTMVVAVLWQVFTRYVLQSSSSFTDELSRFLLIWIGLLGAAYAAGQKMHLAIDLLPSKLTGKKERRLNVIINSLILLFALLALVVGGSKLVYITYILGQTSPSLQVPMAFIYLILPISGFLIIYYKILELMRLRKESIDANQSKTLNDNG